MDAVHQTSPIFQLPYELFQEIFSNLPVYPWPLAIYRLVHDRPWYPTVPEIFWERTRTLLALSATCKETRRVVLPEAWRDYPMRRVHSRDGNTHQIWTKLQSECGIFWGNRCLAVHVRTLVVDFSDGTGRVVKLFVECLTALPNLHTLEITAMWVYGVVLAFATALKEEKPRLRQVQKLTLPPAAHPLLQYCPNVEDLTCCDLVPDERFVESLVTSELNHITMLSSVGVGSGDLWPRVARAYPRIREISAVYREKLERTRIPKLKQYISAFENLSTIQLTYHLSRGDVPGYPSRRGGAQELIWNDLKGTAISQLESSRADGPKKLKTVVLWARNDLELEVVVEGIAV